jgi:hypothetical protein
VALLRFAAYGDTRDGHEVHRKIVGGVMSFHPALVLQTGDLVHNGSVAGGEVRSRGPRGEEGKQPARTTRTREKRKTAPAEFPSPGEGDGVIGRGAG